MGGERRCEMRCWNCGGEVENDDVLVCGGGDRIRLRCGSCVNSCEWDGCDRGFECEYGGVEYGVKWNRCEFVGEMLEKGYVKGESGKVWKVDKVGVVEWWWSRIVKWCRWVWYVVEREKRWGVESELRWWVEKLLK